MHRWKPIASGIAAVSLCAMAWLAAIAFATRLDVKVVDENFHIVQIRAFQAGVYALHPLLTTLPGYHLTMAITLNALSLHSIRSMRWVTAMIAPVCGVIFYFIRLTIGDRRAASTSACFFFLPILFPYYFLIYTDAMSAALILGATLAALRQFNFASAIIITVAILVRQNNVVWAALMPALSISAPLESWQEFSRHLKLLLSSTAPYLLPLATFIIYWIWHGSISLSREEATEHPDLSFHAGNVYFALFLTGLLLPQECWLGFRQFLELALNRPWLFAVPALLLFGAGLQGSPTNYFSQDYFLHNALIGIVDHGLPRALFAVITTIAFCGMCKFPMAHPQAWVIYPVGAFFLSASWLIEPRYAIVPIILLLSLRKIPTETTWRWNMAIWLPLSTIAVWGIFSGNFML